MDTQAKKGRGSSTWSSTSAAESDGKNEREETTPVRVYGVIVNRLMRDILAHALRRRGDLEVVGCGGPSESDHKKIVEAGSEVVLVDFVSAEWLCGLRAVAVQPVRVVAIGMDPEREEFLKAVRYGVCGYLLKDAGANEVVTAVRAAKRGEAICSAQMCMVLFQAVAELKRNGLTEKRFSRKTSLTLRQKMLMRFVAKGLTNKEIAAQLNLSEFTVRNHISRILKQLHATTRSAAVDSMRELQDQLSA